MSKAQVALAAQHAKTVFGDTPLGELLYRELDEARQFNFLGNKGGLMDRLATQIIRLQESQFRLPENHGSE